MSIRRTPLRAVAGFAAVLLAALPVLTQAQPAQVDITAVKKLKTLKKYLYNLLEKRFIKHSFAPFALLILFDKKLSGAL